MAALWRACLLHVLPTYVPLSKEDKKTNLKKKSLRLDTLSSFQSCWPRHRRINGTIFGGICEPCQCFGHAESCDDITGECLVSAFSSGCADWQGWNQLKRPSNSTTTCGTNTWGKKWLDRDLYIELSWKPRVLFHMWSSWLTSISLRIELELDTS